MDRQAAPYRPRVTVHPTKMPTKSGFYNVRSFFGAVHVITYYSLPRNRGLREYIQIQLSFGRLLRRLFRYVRDESREQYRVEHVSSAIGLIVALPVTPNCPCSVASLGFSLSGLTGHKIKMRKDRRQNLQWLEEVDSAGERWNVGNCAESEIFAYANQFTDQTNQAMQLWRETRNGDDEVHIGSFFVCVTYKFGFGVNDITPTPFCKQCRRLADLVGGSVSSSIVDLIGVGV